MARVWPARPSAPVLWACFCREWLQLSASHCEAWWQALAHARTVTGRSPSTDLGLPEGRARRSRRARRLSPCQVLS
jgi:hypothetical protein